MPCEQFEHVFASVAEGRTSHGLLPIEELDRRQHPSATTICCSTTTCRSSPETELQVVHNLMALPGTELSQIAGALASAGARAV